jgi:hypothetical protein
MGLLAFAGVSSFLRHRGPVCGPVARLENDESRVVARLHVQLKWRPLRAAVLALKLRPRERARDAPTAPAEVG